MNTFSRKSDHNRSIDKNSLCYHIEGFLNCSYLNSAIDVGDKLKQSNDNSKDRDIPAVNVNVLIHKKEEWNDRIRHLQSKFSNSNNHTSSPFIYEGCNPKEYKYIGGYSNFIKLVRERYQDLDIPRDIKKESGKECEGGLKEDKRKLSSLTLRIFKILVSQFIGT
ncbi:12784_t:CDS:2 [Cetraspora pellucida]|uniref:12784_t:CDS:1 n=1 Tax=Cetraspora pellucida TaxID=1433469 RepID=A0A9N9D2U7_9GLOM|nr:12784_t:CDS:2 [Cetraspora pellucida]